VEKGVGTRSQKMKVCEHHKRCGNAVPTPLHAWTEVLHSSIGSLNVDLHAPLRQVYQIMQYLLVTLQYNTKKHLVTAF